MNPINVCVAGADGRMGSSIILEIAKKDNMNVVGALTAQDSPNLGKKLKDINLKPNEISIIGPNDLEKAVKPADIYITFTTPQADIDNIPKVVQLKKKIIIGTTGFTKEEIEFLRKVMKNKIPVIMSSNFSIGINILYRFLKLIQFFPKEYDLSVLEAHHKRKIDAPSGTAVDIASKIREIKKYEEIVYGRKGRSQRRENELELFSIRAGGIPGFHEVLIAGENELIRLSHMAFSRKVFADGVLLAIEWLSKQHIPGIYGMNEVLNFSKQ